MRTLNKKIITIIVGWFACMTLAFALNDPVTLLQSVANNMINGLKEHGATLKSKPQVVYELSYRYVVPNAALTEMARRVLPPQTWNSAIPEQREQFKKQFTTTLIRTYASSLSNYKDQSVRFYPLRGGYAGKNSVTVESDIISPDTQPIRVTYRLVRAGDTWKLLDLSVEGVSMLESFRAQYADLLTQGSMSMLLQQMSAHNNR